MGGEGTLSNFQFNLLSFVGLLCPSDDNMAQKNLKKCILLIFEHMTLEL